MAQNKQGELGLLAPGSESPSVPATATAPLECKGIRSTQDFPADPSTLSREQIEHHYQAMRNSHASLTRSRAQLQRRSRELTIALRIEVVIEMINNDVTVKKELHGTPPRAHANHYGGCLQSSGRFPRQTCLPRHHGFQPAPA